MNVVNTLITSFNINSIPDKGSSLSLFPDPLIKEIVSYIKPTDRLMMSARDFDNLTAVNHLFLRLLKGEFFKNIAFTMGVTEDVEGGWSRTAIEASNRFRRLMSQPLTTSDIRDYPETWTWSRTFSSDGTLVLIPPLSSTQLHPDSLIELRDGRCVVNIPSPDCTIIPQDSSQKKCVLKTGIDGLRKHSAWLLELNDSRLLCRFDFGPACIWPLTYPSEQTTIYPQTIIKETDTLKKQTPCLSCILKNK